MSDQRIVWQDPPTPTAGPGSSKWVDRLIPLMSQPGKWALLETKDNGNKARAQVQNLKRIIKLPAGQWEFIARQVDGKGYVYGRYLGPEA